jgi:hypothetical protein
LAADSFTVTTWGRIACAIGGSDRVFVDDIFTIVPGAAPPSASDVTTTRAVKGTYASLDDLSIEAAIDPGAIASAPRGRVTGAVFHDCSAGFRGTWLTLGLTLQLDPKSSRRLDVYLPKLLHVHDGATSSRVELDWGASFRAALHTTDGKESVLCSTPNPTGEGVITGGDGGHACQSTPRLDLERPDSAGAGPWTGPLETAHG